jgi:hypothetical protein
MPIFNNKYKYININNVKLLQILVPINIVNYEPYINVNIMDNNTIMCLETYRNNDYVTYKPMFENMIQIARNTDNISWTISDGSNQIITMDGGVKIDSYKAISPNEMKIYVTNSIERIRKGDRLYFYNTKPERVQMITFSSIDNTTNYTNIKVDNEGQIYKFYLMDSAGTSVIYQFNFKSIVNNMNPDSTNTLYLYVKYNTGYDDYYQIKDITTDHIVIDGTIISGRDIVNCGLAIQPLNGVQSDDQTSLYYRLGWRVKEIQDDGFIIGCSIGINELKTFKPYYRNARDQVQMFLLK